MKGIYRFIFTTGRSGELHGLFIADSDDIEKTKNQTWYQSDCLGKHSEIEVDMSEGHVELVSDKPEDVEFFERLDLTIGYNPIADIIDNGLDEDDAE